MRRSSQPTIIRNNDHRFGVIMVMVGNQGAIDWQALDFEHAATIDVVTSRGPRPRKTAVLTGMVVFLF